MEPGEGIFTALHRELSEELGIAPLEARPLIRVRHVYPERPVLLDVWRVERWDGTPEGREGQTIRWVSLDGLSTLAFPQANLPIVTAARLPSTLLITPDPGHDLDAFLRSLDASLAAAPGLVQLRAKTLDPTAYERLAERVLEICRARQTRLMLSAEPDLARELGAAGVHLSAARLVGLAGRPLSREFWVSAACHGVEELELAQSLGVDFVLASPVRRTQTHPDARPIGWHGLHSISERATVPVYALGGLSAGDLSMAWSHGAQGVAGIRGLWSAAS